MLVLGVAQWTLATRTRIRLIARAPTSCRAIPFAPRSFDIADLVISEESLIARAIEAAKACGIKVGGVRVTPEGAIEIMESGAIKVPQDEYELWKDRL